MDYEVERTGEKKTEYVRELLDKAKRKGTITFQEITDQLGEVELDKNEMDDIYDALASNGIEIVSEVEPDDLEIAELEKGFTWLATTAAGAPMIGFLGTVTGMVQAFFAMASAGSNANVTVLASGIYEALVTTVAGLFVGIIALFAYNYLVSMVNKVMKQLEAKTMEFMDLLNEPAK